MRWRRPGLRTEWREEFGAGHELRQYHRGRPTGVVAITAWDDQHDAGDRVTVSGPDVWLVRERTRLIITEHRTGEHGSARLRIPLRSCVDVAVADEPGLPGATMVRLTLTVRIGQNATFVVPLWFPAEHRAFLDDLARRIRGSAPPPPQRRPVNPLPLLEVDRAPDGDDWVVFRPAPCGDGVLAPRERRLAGDGR
jgi:hypothetical protein